MIFSQSLIVFKLSSQVSILKILASEKPEQLFASFLLCLSVTFSLAQEGGICFFANRYFPSPTNLRHS